MEPERLGPYRIVRTLGKGGMGKVYQGVNVESSEPAAVKILSTVLSNEPDFRLRFEAEIDTLKKLRHPNIVRLFGFGEQEGLLFFAMEFVEGLSLEEELGRGRRFPWREVAGIGIQTCRALRHAHDRGIIHRDIKPANLLLTADGQIKLSDFGIARLFGNTRMTLAGNVLGTVEYMAPEQADAKPVGPKTNLYSLGGVMYALLVGRPPFRAPSLAAMLEKHRSARPEPVTRFNNDVPAELDQIIRQLLEKAPRDRVTNATVLSRRLEAMLHALPGGPETPTGEPTGSDGDPGLTAAVPRPPHVDDDQTPPTREMTGYGGVSPSRGVPPQPDVRMAETPKTSAFAEYAEGSDSFQTMREADAEEKDRGGHFVTVAEEDLDRVEEPGHRLLISIQTWVLALALVAVGLMVWYLLQPPTADGLYQQIVQVTSEGTVSSYRRAKDDIDEFLRRYSTDSRCEQLREYLLEIELDTLENQFNLRVRGLAHPANLLPVEAAYQEALSYARLSPELGAERLDALIRLYGDRKELSGPTGRCLELARRRLKQLQLQISRHAEVRRAWIEERLDHADEVEDANPDKARGIRQAVVMLFETKPWAAQPVARARQALGTQKGGEEAPPNAEPAPTEQGSEQK